VKRRGATHWSEIRRAIKHLEHAKDRLHEADLMHLIGNERCIGAIQWVICELHKTQDPI